MSIGCSIYFTPVDRLWIGTPEFIRGIANLFGVERMESLCVWRTVDAPPGVELDWYESEEKLLELPAPSIEATISVQRTEAGCTTIMDLPDSQKLTEVIADAVIDTLPERLSEDWVPIYATIHNSQWEVFDQGGDRMGGGACCVELGNRLGYPIDMQGYLRELAANNICIYAERVEVVK